MSKKVKIFSIAAAILIIIIVVSTFGGDKKTTTTTTGPLSSSAGVVPVGGVSEQSTAENGPSGEFAVLLSSIKSIVIDDSIFSNPAYRALRDHPITLGTDIVGRTNPFAPVGTDGVDLSSAPTVQTLQPGKITSNSAELSAQVSFSTSAPVTMVFQYGTTDQFGGVTVPQTLSKSGVAVATLTGLSSNTTYHVQAVAVVGSTTSNGNTMTFTTTTPPGTR